MEAAAILLVLLALGSSVPLNCPNDPKDYRNGQSIRLTPRQQLVSTIYQDIDVIIDYRDGSVSNSIRNSGTWEPNKLRTMARFVKEGDTILNIGSHIGLQAVVLGKIAGQKGRLYIFEPYSVSYSIVLKNIHLNNLANIASVYRVGASSQKSKGSIIVSQSNTGGATIYEGKQAMKRAQPYKAEDVDLDKVDSVLPEHTAVDFALIDAERMEVECLEGMKETMGRSPNLIMMCEWSAYSLTSADFAKRKKELLEWLQDQGFRFYTLKGGKEPCTDHIFIEEPIERIVSLPDLEDILIVRKHINPNDLK